MCIFANGNALQTETTKADVEAALNEVKILEPEANAARTTANRDARWAFYAKLKLNSLRSLFFLRSFCQHHDIPAVGVFVVVAVSAACLGLCVGISFELPILPSFVLVLIFALLGSVLGIYLLWLPATNDLPSVIANCEQEQVAAEIARQQSLDYRISVDTPYRNAQTRYLNLQTALEQQRELQRRQIAENEQRQKAAESEQRKRDEQLRKNTEYSLWKQNIEKRVQEDRVKSDRRSLVKSRESRLQSLFRRNWKELRGEEFEWFLKEVFEALGYDVELTKRSHDKGVDLVVSGWERRIAVQAKGWDERNSVGTKAIQEAHFGMAIYDCSESAVITNSRILKRARHDARKVNCTLIDLDQMKAFILGRGAF